MVPSIDAQADNSTRSQNDGKGYVWTRHEGPAVVKHAIDVRCFNCKENALQINVMVLVICIEITNTVSTLVVTPIRTQIRAAQSSAHPLNDAVPTHTRT
jgi:hypothetical protein